MKTTSLLAGLSGLLMAAVCLLVSSGTAFGQATQTTLVNQDGDWFNTTTLWTGNAVPSASVGTIAVQINAGSDVTLSGGSATVYGALRVNSNNTTGAAASLTVNGGTLKTFANPIFDPPAGTSLDSYIGNNANGGTLNISGDGVVIFQGDKTFVGNSNDDKGVVNVSGGSLIIAGLDDNTVANSSPALVVGNGGSLGSLNLSGGHIFQDNTVITIGLSGNAASDNTSVFNVTGGSLTATGGASNIVVGSRQSALMTVSGGIVDVGDDLIVGNDSRYLGSGSSQTNRVVITGGEVSGIDDIVMNAGNQTGVASVNGAVNNIIDVEGGVLGAQNLLIGGGQNAPSDIVTNTMNVSGGLASFSASVEIGSAGTVNSSDNILNVSGGIFHASGQMIVGETGGRGVVNQSGGSIQVASLDVGQDAPVGSANPSDGTINLTGGTFTTNGNTNIGQNNTGSLNVSGGEFRINENGGNNQRMSIGNQAGSVGTVTLSGDGVILTDFGGSGNQVYVGNLGGGTWDQTGGYFDSVGNDLMNVGAGSGGNGTLKVSGGTFGSGSNALTFASTVNATASGEISGGVVSVGGINIAGGLGTGSAAVPQPEWVEAQAVVTISDGADVTTANDIVIGQNDDTIGTLNITGGVVNVGNGNGDDLIVGNLGDAPNNGAGSWNLGSGATGVLNISGGVVNIQDNLTAGIGTYSRGTINISGGVVALGLASSGGLIIDSKSGSTSTVNFTMTGGELRTELIDIDTGTSANAATNQSNSFSGGLVKGLSIADGGTGSITLAAGTATGEILNISGATFDLEGGGISDNNATQNAILVSGGNVFNAQNIDANVTMSGGEINMTEDDTGRSMSLEDENLTVTGGMISFDLFKPGTATSGGSNQAEFSMNGGENSGLYGITTLDIDAVTIQVLADNLVGGFSLGDRWDLIDLVGGGDFAPGAVMGVSFLLPMLPGGLFWDTTTDFATNGQIFIVVPEPSVVFLMALAPFLSLLPRRRRGS